MDTRTQDTGNPDTRTGDPRQAPPARRGRAVVLGAAAGAGLVAYVVTLLSDDGPLWASLIAVAVVVLITAVAEAAWPPRR